MLELFGFVDKVAAALLVEHPRHLALVFRIAACNVHGRHDFYEASLCLAQLVFQSAAFQQPEVVVKVYGFVLAMSSRTIILSFYTFWGQRYRKKMEKTCNHLKNFSLPRAEKRREYSRSKKNGKTFGRLSAYSYLCSRIAGFATNNNSKKTKHYGRLPGGNL